MSKANKIWKDGEVIPQQSLILNGMDRIAILGDGLFESIQAVDGSILNWDNHMSRLFKGLEYCQFQYDWDSDWLLCGVKHLLEQNDCDSASIRITISRGHHSLGYLPGDQCKASAWIYLREPAKMISNTITATISRQPIFSKDPLQSLKSTSRLHYVLSSIDAASRNAQEALILNEKNQIAEWTSGNFFMWFDGSLSIPDPSCGALPGTTAPFVIRAAEELGWKIRKGFMQPDELPPAASLLMSNSLRGIQCITRLDDREFPQLELLQELRNLTKALIPKTSIR